MSFITERFIECINQLKEQDKIRSFRQFALSLGYLPQNLNELLKGRREVSVDLVRKAVELYKINPTYLHTGEGSIFDMETNKHDLRILTVVTDAYNEERIVHVPVPAQAGYISELADPVFYNELPTYSLPEFRFSKGTHRSFDVSGDSMEPSLEEGDMVVCSYLEPDRWVQGIKDNTVFVIVTKCDVVVKRVVNNLKLNECIRLISDNDYYRPYDIHADDIKELWYVRVKISPFSHGKPAGALESVIEEKENLIKDQNEMIRFLKQTIEKLSPVS